MLGEYSSVELFNIGSGDGLKSFWHQTITWTEADFMLTATL